MMSTTDEVNQSQPTYSHVRGFLIHVSGFMLFHACYIQAGVGVVMLIKVGLLLPSVSSGSNTEQSCSIWSISLENCPEWNVKTVGLKLSGILLKIWELQLARLFC